MKFWKPLSKFRYSDERDEFKYHTDFSLDPGESMEFFLSNNYNHPLIREKVPEGKVYKIHFEMAVEIFDKE